MLKVKQVIASNQSSGLSFSYKTGVMLNILKRNSLPIIGAMIYIVAFQLAPQGFAQNALSVGFIVFMLCCSTTASFYLLMFIICENELLTINNTTSVTMIYIFLFTVVSIVKSGLFKNLPIGKYNLIAITLLFIITLLLLVFGISGQFFNFTKCLFFLYYIRCILKENEGAEVDLHARSFRWMAIGINFCGVISLILNGTPTITTRYTFDASITINYLAIICALTIVNLLYCILTSGSKHAAFDYAMISGCAIWGLLTHSRSFLLATAIGIMLIVIFSQSIVRKVKILLSILLLVGLITTIIRMSPDTAALLDIVMNRIFSPTGDDISNGRYDLWAQTIKAMNGNITYLLFGAGEYDKIGAVFNNKVLVAHNMFLETWVIFGWVGSVLITLLFGNFIRTNIFKRKANNPQFISFVPLIVMLCVLFFSHHFIGRSMSIVFILSFIPISSSTSSISNQKG